MTISRWSCIVRSWLALGLALAALPALGACPDAKKATDLKLARDGNWTCLGERADAKEEYDAKLADLKYEHKNGGLKRIPAFLLPAMAVSGQLEETTANNAGADEQGVPIRFDTSESLRQISVGWGKKKIIEDLIVALSGPEALSKQNKWLRTLLVDPITVDASFSYGRVVQFKNTTADLDDLSTKESWSVKASYTMPLDKLFQVDY